MSRQAASIQPCRQDRPKKPRLFARAAAPGLPHPTGEDTSLLVETHQPACCAVLVPTTGFGMKASNAFKPPRPCHNCEPCELGSSGGAQTEAAYVKLCTAQLKPQARAAPLSKRLPVALVGWLFGWQGYRVLTTDTTLFVASCCCCMYRLYQAGDQQSVSTISTGG
jgi:hypothetical protein